MCEDERRPRRPTPMGPGTFDAFVGNVDPADVSEVAHETAAVLVGTGRAEHDPELTARLVHLVDELGLSTVAALWSAQPAVSLPGCLWRMYVLREWVQRNPVELSADYRTGLAHASVSHAVAGASEPPDPASMVSLSDSILTGVFDGDLAVALERAAAFCRVISIGRAHRADDHDGVDDTLATAQTRSAAALLSTAQDLTRCAAAWRDGRLH
ncbi:hypothetical protein ATK17_2788 [Branchiibius hedensis]|uniref:DNA-directed RNA polymerase subunit beta n=1 Tax=Branchiibius hedensis TaxID=672460 RepID=A0A2Y9C242_9MICO|nr:hypothetical protein [Branchiibius hedensis]PWJ26621.1 hypothetical protein ATK17_2788 [Branchiibius hedensis]SSA35433.1 hypothetical protein SAMN04489750_2788 [Branchiibius hedensis]